MSEDRKRQTGVEYPDTLDVVERDGKEYQIVAMGTGIGVGNDFYLLKDIETEEITKIKGSRFTPFTEMRKPGEGKVRKRDEGVRVTGTLTGGEEE